jgi:hypothetical protein
MEIGRRFRLSMNRGDSMDRGALGEFWASVANHQNRTLKATHQNGTLKANRFIANVHALTRPFPDLWIRFCRVSAAAPGSAVPVIPRRLVPVAPVVPMGLVVTVGQVFHFSKEMFRQSVLPMLTYPAIGRLASTRKAWKRILCPHCFADASET